MENMDPHGYGIWHVDTRFYVAISHAEQTGICKAHGGLCNSVRYVSSLVWRALVHGWRHQDIAAVQWSWHVVDRTQRTCNFAFLGGSCQDSTRHQAANGKVAPSSRRRL